MTRGPFLSKFKNHTEELVKAVENQIDLEYDHPELYQKVYNYYKEGDIYFYDDKDKDYNIVIDELEYDLLKFGVMG